MVPRFLLLSLSIFLFVPSHVILLPRVAKRAGVGWIIIIQGDRTTSIWSFALRLSAPCQGLYSEASLSM